MASSHPHDPKSLPSPNTSDGVSTHSHSTSVWPWWGHPDRMRSFRHVRQNEVPEEQGWFPYLCLGHRNSQKTRAHWSQTMAPCVPFSLNWTLNMVLSKRGSLYSAVQNIKANKQTKTCVISVGCCPEFSENSLLVNLNTSQPKILYMYTAQIMYWA